MRRESLLYCAYVVAVFDLLCAFLFVSLSFCKIASHLSWLTIFAACFGVFWLTLILLLLFGIYRRNTELILYWIIFSCVGISVELCLIIYAFIRQSTFQKALVGNTFVLCLGLLVEAIFAIIVYQFYLAQCRCHASGLNQVNTAPKQTRVRSDRCPRKSNEESCCSSIKSILKPSCHILQSADYNSPYRCGTKEKRKA